MEPTGSDPALGVPAVGAPPPESCSISLTTVSVRSFGTSILVNGDAYDVKAGGFQTAGGIRVRF